MSDAAAPTSARPAVAAARSDPRRDTTAAWSDARFARRAVAAVFIANGLLFASWTAHIPSVQHSLHFSDGKPYRERLTAARRSSKMRDAVQAGRGTIEGQPVAFGLFLFGFMGGSMGSVVGEKVARVFERATEQQMPVVILHSSGGARMQEGIFSLMQMAKGVAARERLRAAKLPFISILLDPTTGGVAASFALIGDVQIAEPKALIGFAGPRVIETTIRQKLPEGFQRAEFLLEHGMIDMIVPRLELKTRLGQLLKLLGGKRS